MNHVIHSQISPWFASPELGHMEVYVDLCRAQQASQPTET